MLKKLKNSTFENLFPIFYCDTVTITLIKTTKMTTQNLFIFANFYLHKYINFRKFLFAPLFLKQCNTHVSQKN